MPSLATMVPANTFRVVGDRGDVPEAYIPMDGSPRSLALLAETVRRMPGVPSARSAAVAAGGDTFILQAQIVPERGRPVADQLFAAADRLRRRGGVKSRAVMREVVPE